MCGHMGVLIRHALPAQVQISFIHALPRCKVLYVLPSDLKTHISAFPLDVFGKEIFSLDNVRRLRGQDIPDPCSKAAP